MDATGKIFQISKFPNTLSKIGEIYIPYKFIWSGCIPPKIKQDILAHKGSQTTSATPGDYLASWNRKPMGEQDLLASMTMNQDFLKLGQGTYCRHDFFFCVCMFCFFISIAQWGVEEDNTSMSKVVKGKGKIGGKNGKTGKFAEEKTMNRQTAFKITIHIKYCIKVRKPVFNINYVWQILVWQRHLCSKFGRQRGAPQALLGPVFFFFFFFSLFYQLLSSAFDFSIGKIFSKAKNSSCELYKVRDVNKIWR